jgi:type I restriction enzyme M protein
MGRDTLSNDIWHACDIMRRDNNCGGVMEYVEHLAWLLFLRFLDGQEEIFEAEAAIANRTYTRILEREFSWSAWVPLFLGERDPSDPGKRRPPKCGADDLLPFVHGTLFPHMRALSGTPEAEIIAGVFSDRNVVVCASPYNLKDV